MVNEFSSNRPEMRTKETFWGCKLLVGSHMSQRVALGLGPKASRDSPVVPGLPSNLDRLFPANARRGLAMFLTMIARSAAIAPFRHRRIRLEWPTSIATR